MYTTDSYDIEELDDMMDLFEDLDYDEDYDEDYDDDDGESDLMERRRRRMMRRPRRSVVPKRGLFPRRRSGAGKSKYVTQGQLKAAMDQTEKSIKAVSARVNSVSSEQMRQATALKKETMNRKKETAALKKDLNSKLELLTILPLLLQPDSVKATTKEGEKDVLIKSDNILNSILPLLLIGGGSLGGQSGSGDSNSSLNTLLPLVLIAGAGK